MTADLKPAKDMRGPIRRMMPLLGLEVGTSLFDLLTYRHYDGSLDEETIFSDLRRYIKPTKATPKANLLKP